MNVPIVWSSQSLKTYYNTLHYLEVNWSQKALNTFIERTEYVLKLISQNPHLYPYSIQNDVFKSVLSK